MLSALWHNYLYQPLFNFLIWIYNNWTDMNFGWAVVYLTVILRVVLLPFSLINERIRVKNAQIAEDVHKLEKEYQTDAIRRNEEIRWLLKQRRVQPWARVVVLGVQLLVLILLYQVFLRGITGEKILSVLYPSVDFPGFIETKFYGFELGDVRTFIWPGIVAVWLFAEIYADLHKKGKIKKKDLMFFLLFPTFVFGILWYLPMVKSLFILTSMVFSFIIALLFKALFGGEPKKVKTSG
jgi:membrane protein insertase Oxa1/YidC/SpoIIIJ